MMTTNDLLSEEQPSVQQLQMELHLMTLKVDKLTKENLELKTHIKNTAGNDKSLRHDYEVQSIDKDRLSKLVDQLKNEKVHLVETVLQLSDEVDQMHKASDHFESDSQRFIHTEMMIKAARKRLGLQIIGVLEMNQIARDHPIMKEICDIINDEDQPKCIVTSNASSGESTSLFLPTPTTVTSSSDSFATEDDNIRGSGSQRLDAESLIANENALYRQSQLMLDALYSGNGSALGTGHEAIPFKATTGSSFKSSLLRNSIKSGSVKSGESRRKQSATLERNETESVISSVSTHRSGRSKNKLKNNNKIQSQITAENLAILNKMNADEDREHGTAGDCSKIRPSSQQLDYAVKKTKTIEETTVSWWPKLF